jgi:hypothetical protein
MVTEIQADAFWQCLRLESLFIPASVAHIDGSSFYGTGLRDIRVERNSQSFSVLGRFLVDLGQRSVVRYFGEDSLVTVPKGIAVLSAFSFRGCEFVKEIRFEMDSRVCEIGSAGFSECRSLTSICIPNTVEVIGSNCFWHCDSLCEVMFESPSKLRRIESGGFSWCSRLSSICIPSSVEILCSDCFADCRSLREVFFQSPSRLSRIESAAFTGCPSLSRFYVPESHRGLFESWLNISDCPNFTLLSSDAEVADPV